MNKIIGIISGDPNSINSEIIAKVWRKKEKFKKLNFFIIGNYSLLKKQFVKLGYSIKLNKINKIKNNNFKNSLNIFDVPIRSSKLFNVPLTKKHKYIENSFKVAINLLDKKEIVGLINCPLNKRDLSLRRKFSGVTEFLAKKKGVFGEEVMLIYNKTLSVSPLTTHIKLNSVSKNISKNKIIRKILTLNKFYKNKLKTKAKIGVLGLNPHNDEMRNKSEEKKIILPAIKSLRKKKVLVYGPISPDTAFLNYKKKGFNILVGMYHDQVLAPYKAIFKFKAINITLGLPFIRISPDHGVGRDIIKKNKANSESLIECIKFFKEINV